MSLSDRPLWTQEKALACDMATKQDVLDVQQMIEEADGYVFTADYFKGVCSGNRLMHIVAEVGLKIVNLNVVAGLSRCKAQGFTEAECKRLFVPLNVRVFRDNDSNNAWVAEKNGVKSPIFAVRAIRSDSYT